MAEPLDPNDLVTIEDAAISGMRGDAGSWRCALVFVGWVLSSRIL